MKKLLRILKIVSPLVVVWVGFYFGYLIFDTAPEKIWYGLPFIFTGILVFAVSICLAIQGILDE